MQQQENIRDRRKRLAEVPRACNACKMRKIRCDRVFPCANCQAASITCEKAEAKTDRQANQKISQLENRIKSLESRMIHCEAQGVSPLNRSDTSSSSRQHQQEKHTSDTYNGVTSFLHQSSEAHARARALPSSNANPMLQQHVGTLDALLGPPRTDLNNSTTAPGLGEMATMPLVPVEVATAIIHSIKRDPPVFLRSWALNDVALVEGLCRELYFPTQHISTGHFASVHGILYFFCREFLMMKSSLCATLNLSNYKAVLETNFDVSVRHFDVLSKPSFENILALTLGAIKAHGEARHSLYSTMLSNAIAKCQELGWHRESSYRKVSASRASSMRRLFWTLYIFDHNTSLLLGRAAYLQDFDIDTAAPEVSSASGSRPWDESLIKFISLGRLQAEAYDKLYSVKAMGQSQSSREGHMKRLESLLQQWQSDITSIVPDLCDHPRVFEFSKTHWNLICWSTLTLIFRSDSTLDGHLRVNSSCLHYARISLRGLLDCFASFQDFGVVPESEFANPFLLFTSFVPFVAIFANTVATPRVDDDDIELLKEVVKVLHRVQDASPETKRLYNISAAFASFGAEHQRLSGDSHTNVETSLRGPRLDTDDPTWQYFFDPALLQDLMAGDLSLSLGDTMLESFVTGS